MMRKNLTTDLRDVRVNEKIVLSGMWITMLFVFAYIDIFGFWRADVISGALTGRVPGPNLVIDQRFLVLTTAYILIPALMIIASLLTPARVNRILNIVAGSVYFASVLATVIGESWLYYIIGSIVEMTLLLVIVWTAWSWRESASSSPTVARLSENADI